MRDKIAFLSIDIRWDTVEWENVVEKNSNDSIIDPKQISKALDRIGVSRDHRRQAFAEQRSTFENQAWMEEIDGFKKESISRRRNEKARAHTSEIISTT